MNLVERCAYGSRWRHRHPVEKLVLSLGMLLISLVVPPYPGGLIIFAAMAGAAVMGAGVPQGAYLRLLAAPAGFAAAGALAVAVTVGPGWQMAVSPAGLLSAGKVLLRSLGAVASLLLLALTTPIADLLGQLRRWRVPNVLLDVMLLIYRFLSILLSAVGAMSSAQAARLGYGSLRQSLRSLAMLVAALLGQGLNRARRAEIGLAARGYDGRLVVLDRPGKPSVPALVAVLGVQALVALISFAWGEGWL